MGRSRVRARSRGLQAPFPRNEHRGRHGDGDGTRICNGPGVYEQPSNAVVGLSEQPEGPIAHRAWHARARRRTCGSRVAYQLTVLTSRAPDDTLMEAAVSFWHNAVARH